MDSLRDLETKRQIRDFIRRYIHSHKQPIRRENDFKILQNELIKFDSLPVFGEAIRVAKGKINTTLENSNDLKKYVEKLHFNFVRLTA